MVMPSRKMKNTLFCIRSALASTFAFAAMPQALAETSLPTKASEKLESLRQEYMRANPGLKIYTIDPDRFATLRAEGQTAQEAINKITAEQGSSALKIETGKAIAETMLRSRLEFGEHLESLTDDFRGPSATAWRLNILECVITPSDYISNTMLPLNVEMELLYTHRHEMNHCADNGYAYARFLQAEKIDTPGYLATSLDWAYFNSLDMKGEIFADLAAAGDMIVHDGATTSFIKTLSDQRKRRLGHANDLAHFSSFALDELKQHIDKMGIDAFRALTPETRTEIYYLLTEIHGLNTDQFLLYNQLARIGTILYQLNPDPGIIQRIAMISDEDRAHLNLYIEAAAESLRGSSPTELSPLKKRKAQLVDEWDAQKTLLKKAEKYSNLPKADALTQARNILLDHLRHRLDANPLDPVTTAKIAKLHVEYHRLMTAHRLRAPDDKVLVIPPELRR